MDSLETDRHGEHIVLEEGAYLSDVFCEKGLYTDNIKTNLGKPSPKISSSF